jgi:hypothetical protein
LFSYFPFSSRDGKAARSVHAPFPEELTRACRRLGIPWTRCIFVVHVAEQRLFSYQRRPNRKFDFSGATRAHSPAAPTFPELPNNYLWLRAFRISTSRFGVGQWKDSRQTPLGLHRIAKKIGGGLPAGTVFQGRQPVGYTWQGNADAPIAHRILWLEGLDPGFNQGGAVDTFSRYIYIHGLGDERQLGRPASVGCIHMAARDLIPLFDLAPVGSLVWIEGGCR